MGMPFLPMHAHDNISVGRPEEFQLLKVSLPKGLQLVYQCHPCKLGDEYTFNLLW